METLATTGWLVLVIATTKYAERPDKDFDEKSHDKNEDANDLSFVLFKETPMRKMTREMTMRMMKKIYGRFYQ